VVGSAAAREEEGWKESARLARAPGVALICTRPAVDDGREFSLVLIEKIEHYQYLCPIG
jgi:hypothetical protein